MKRPWGIVIGMVIAGLAVVPLATAGAQVPPTTAETPTAPEGSVPPGGEVQCTTGAALDPDHGPPGTEVTVSTTFPGNCDDISYVFLSAMTCFGQVTGGDIPEALGFEMAVDPSTGDASGSFVAPIGVPNPPVVDATQPLSVTVTCSVPSGQVSSPPASTEGPTGTTTYVYPESIYTLELFAANDGEQPTLVDNDQVDNDVVSATPPFTG